jgi:hypothetical protein
MITTLRHYAIFFRHAIFITPLFHYAMPFFHFDISSIIAATLFSRHSAIIFHFAHFITAIIFISIFSSFFDLFFFHYAIIAIDAIR